MDQILSLDDAVMGAAEAPPSIRIEYRDQIARYGAAGIDRVIPWLSDPQLAAFAVRVIARAGDFGARERAVEVLQAAFATVPGHARLDVQAALETIGPGPPRTRVPRAVKSPALPISLDELVVGNVY